MTPQRMAAFRLSEELLEALQAIKARDGVPVSEQVRRALEAWIESKGVKAKTPERKPAATRKRP